MFKNKKNLLKAALSSMSALVISALMISPNAEAQIFDNSNANANYVGSATSVIKMKGGKATSVANTYNANADGQILGLGASAGDRIIGTVIWEKCDLQNVQTGLFYTNLQVGDGSSATSTTKYFVDANVSEVFARVAGKSTTIMHNGIFTYDGANAQTILVSGGSGTNNNYKTLNLTEAGAKSITGGTVIADNVTIPATATTATVDNSGTLHLKGAATTPSTVVGTLTFADGNSGNSFIMDAGTRIEVSGSLSNLDTDKNNINLDASTDPSTVAYSANAVIMPVVTGNPYGRLELSSGNVTMNGNIYIAGQVGDALRFPADGTIITGATATTATDTIVFQHATSNATYGGTGEVIGWIKRTASNTGTPYNFHNAATILQYGDVPTNFAMQSLPGTKPNKALITGGYGYVNRQTQIEYTGTGSIANMTYGYLGSEWVAGTATDAPGEAYARGFEAFDDSEPMFLLTGENSGAAVAWVPNSVTGFNTMVQTGAIALNGVAAPGTVGLNGFDFASASQLVFSDEPVVFISIKNGRWSNPGTWNMGLTPTPIDAVKLETTVYTGLYDGNNLFGLGPWDVDETTLNGGIQNGAVVLAKSVEITDKANAALVVGNYDTSMDFTASLVFGTVTNKNARTNTEALAIGTLPSAGLNGIYVMGEGGSNGAVGLFNPISLFNEGQFNNEGVTEIGDGCN